MKVVIRRIGNSLGIIIPKQALDRWGLAEGDFLEVGDAGIELPANAHRKLDELRRTLALEVVRRFSAAQIRAKILANLHRWKQSGAWVPDYDQWLAIADSGDDGRLFAAMMRDDEDGDRLRQSMPYTGLLPRELVRRLHEQAAA